MTSERAFAGTILIESAACGVARRSILGLVALENPERFWILAHARNILMNQRFGAGCLRKFKKILDGGFYWPRPLYFDRRDARGVCNILSTVPMQTIEIQILQRGSTPTSIQPSSLNVVNKLNWQVCMDLFILVPK